MTTRKQRNDIVTFADYYRQHFRTDIERFIQSIPAESRNHDHDKSVFTIQYERLTKTHPTWMASRLRSVHTLPSHYSSQFLWTRSATRISSHTTLNSAA